MLRILSSGRERFLSVYASGSVGREKGLVKRSIGSGNLRTRNCGYQRALESEWMMRGKAFLLRSEYAIC